LATRPTRAQSATAPLSDSCRLLQEASHHRVFRRAKAHIELELILKLVLHKAIIFGDDEGRLVEADLQGEGIIRHPRPAERRRLGPIAERVRFTFLPTAGHHHKTLLLA